MRILSAAAFLLFATTAAPALAQSATAATPPDAGATADTEDFNRETVTIGAGAAYLPDYEGSNDYRFTAVPGAIGSVSGFNFTLAGNRLSVDLIPDRPRAGVDFQLGPLAVLDFNRSSLKSIDDPRIRALGKRKTAIELGGYASIGKTGVVTSAYDRLSISLSYRHDVNDVHDSGILQPSINYVTPVSRTAAVAVFASAEHAENGYADTYFTVLPTQVAASTLPAYRARGGWKNYTLGVLGTVSLTGDLLHGFKLVAGGTYARLLNDFGDSPVVSIAGRRSQFLGAVGLAYTF